MPIVAVFEGPSFTRANYEINPSFEVFVQGSYTNYKSSTALAPTPVSTGIVNSGDTSASVLNARSPLVAPGRRITGFVVPVTNPFVSNDLRTLLNTRIGDDAGDLRMVEVQKLEHALRKPGGLEGLGVALGYKRGLRRHLEDYAIAREERRHHRVHRSEPGIIPRRDHQHHAERLATDEPAEAGLFRNRNFGKRLLGNAAHVQRALMKPALDLTRALAERAAHLPAELDGEVVGTLDAPLGHPPTDRCPLGYWNLLPRSLRSNRFLERALNLPARCNPALCVHRAVDRGNRALDFHGAEYSGRRSTRRARASMTSAQVTPKGR